MAFYMSQPTGTISLQKLTQFANTRLSFLFEVFDSRANRVDLFDVVKDIETVEDSECLIEGTCKDRISHAILRLACCGDQDMSNFFVTAETLLFDFRFSCMTKDELYKTFKSVDRYRRRKCLTGSSALNVLNTIYEQCASWRKVIQKYLNGEGHFLLPFQSVPQLVGKREVVLDHGVAYVPFYRLREVCTDVFWQLLSDSVRAAKMKFSTDDERILNLTKSIMTQFHCKFSRGFSGFRQPHSILHTQVDELVSQFPPCMVYMHKQLRTKHRLAHHARIQYTLFLKEVGLPVHEAILFWKEEYSKNGHQEARCHHDWSANEKRYIYSIRHLYGLEGSRINYRGHSCTAIQNNYYGPQDESGCPFSHFDEDHLLQLLCEEDLQYIGEEILTLTSKKLFSAACHKVFTSRIEQEHKFHIHRNSDIKRLHQPFEKSDFPNISNRNRLVTIQTDCCSVCNKACDMEDLSLHVKSKISGFNSDQRASCEHCASHAKLDRKDNTSCCRKHVFQRSDTENKGVCNSIITKKSCKTVPESFAIVSINCNSVTESCKSISENCNDVSESCKIVSESCNNISEGCNSVSESCNSVSENCKSVSESCNSVPESCNNVSESCNSLSESCNSVSESCTSVSNMEVDSVEWSDTIGFRLSAEDETVMETSYNESDQRTVTARSDGGQTSYDSNTTSNTTLSQCKKVVSANVMQRHLQPFSKDQLLSEKKADDNVTEKVNKLNGHDYLNSLNCPCGICRREKTVTFSKPVDYYLSYTKLLKDIKNT